MRWFWFVEAALAMAIIAGLVVEHDWATIIGIIAAVWFLSGIMVVLAFDRIIKQWLGISRWPTPRSRRERKP